METTGVLEKTSFESWTDQEIVDRVKAGHTALYEIIMRRYNQRLYRVARAILRDDAESEDVMQDAYVRAYQHLGQFAGRAPFSTWLTRIAVHEALARARNRKRNPQLDDDFEEDGELLMNMAEPSPGPEDNASRAEVSQLLEEAVLGLPEQYRIVVALRDIEEMSTAETAATLDLTEENVKVRLHRGRAMARNWLLSRVGAAAKDAFPFMGVRCDRVVAAVFARLAIERRPSTLE
ncbi:MAG TPA: RNA polymerase sigma factor [Candidatus Sulfotelmatobacter sp.]|jgi:RNA polymerase sigma-70 factor (ECF subfamily)|nr:RNA polymerase sigma factor [Candidatus Sulfotelmatobacter sp.]